MLWHDTDNERLSKEFLALPTVSKTLTTRLEFSEPLGPVTKKVVSLIEQADVDSTMFWDQSAGVFRP
jgi:hypothetical protein